MKKFFLTVYLIIFLTSLPVFAKEKTVNTTENISLFSKKGLFEKVSKNRNISVEDEIKKTFAANLKYSNEHNSDALANLYSDNYYSEDGFDKKIYLELIKKTWKAYPDIKYKLNIRSITVNDRTAIVHVNENAYANTPTHSSIINEFGYLESFSDIVYYIEKVSDQWLIVSDKIIFEKTYLRYGSAKNIFANLIAPSQIPAGKQYTVSLKIEPENNTFVIGSIGKEDITYPQKTAEEIFRKLPKDGILERMFTANSKNINEYASASYGITKAVNSGKEIKIYVTGLGFITQRVNIIPKNNFIKVEDEKNK